MFDKGRTLSSIPHSDRDASRLKHREIVPKADARLRLRLVLVLVFNKMIFISQPSVLPTPLKPFENLGFIFFLDAR